MTAAPAGRPAEPAPEAASASFSLGELLLYFLRLGATAFGGPIALVGHMQKDLVEERRWISRQDYLEGLALAQLMPGPLAAQLAMYLGWVKARVAGATLVAVAFVLPSWLMVLGLSWLYLRYGGLPYGGPRRGGHRAGAPRHRGLAHRRHRARHPGHAHLGEEGARAARHPGGRRGRGRRPRRGRSVSSGVRAAAAVMSFPEVEAVRGRS
ncbi:MAG TPA: chromate transporter [Anaeromyxobacteraceae bacterium]|nr:chromate transporter [Anaeromyxobacteraceae bacterium]